MFELENEGANPQIQNEEEKSSREKNILNAIFCEKKDWICLMKGTPAE